MAANCGAVDHVLPVICQPKFNEGLKQSVPNSLLGPAAEAHLDRIPLPVALMHVAPGAADPKNMQHGIQVSPIIVRGPGLPSTFGGHQSFDDPPFHIRKVAASQNSLLKAVLNHASPDLEIHFANRP
jgi:hypothetical protein